MSRDEIETQWDPQWVSKDKSQGKGIHPDLLRPALPDSWAKAQTRGGEVVAAESKATGQRIALMCSGLIRRTVDDQYIAAPTVAMVAWLMRECGVLAR